MILSYGEVGGPPAGFREDSQEKRAREALQMKLAVHRKDRRVDDEAEFRAHITDYETFLATNQKRVNLLLNRILWASMLIGPMLMLALRLGIFHSVTYTSCIVVTLLVLALSCVHYVLINKDGHTMRAAVIAFLAMDCLLVLMNSAHIGIYITWFCVPLVSLLFCDFKLFGIAVALNYCMMALSVWLVAPYYASLRVDFSSAFQYFAGRMGGFTIETAIMVMAGYAVCRLYTSHYRELIYTIQSIEAQKEKEKQLIRITMTDELTQLNNRRSYDADVEALRDKALEADFVVFSVDINGLKEANDTGGHMAGDELLTAAAACLADVFTGIGKVYRTGGDEFIAVANTDAPAQIKDQLESLSARWHGQGVEGLSLSVGYAAHSEHPELGLHDLEILADQMMYEEKRRYYSISGNDRRVRG